MAPRAWYDRFRDRPRRPGVGTGQQAQPLPRADYYGGIPAESTLHAYEYLLGSLRANAPGASDQDFLQMSKAYVGAPYLAINAKAVQAAEADVQLVEKDLDDPDAEEPLSLHEDAAKLLLEPNPDDDFADILEQVSIQYDLTGTAAVWAPHDVTDSMDRPEEIYVLSTASLLPQPISPRYPKGAWLVQPWYPAGPYAMIPVGQGVGAVVPAEQVIRIKSPHPLFRWIGYATMFAISAQIDALRMVDVSRTNALLKGIDPTAVMTFDPSLRKPTEPELRRLEEQLKAVYGGPANVGRIFMAPFGADVKKLSNTPAEMAYQEGFEQLLDFTVATFGINKAVAGMTGDLNYATLYASWRGFHMARLNPFLHKVARKLTRNLFQRFYGKHVCLKVEGKSITDESMLLQQLDTMGKAGAVKVGEVRRAVARSGFPIALDRTEKDDEWVGQAAAGQVPGGAPPASKPEGPGGREEEQSRPRNPEGRGSRPPANLHDRQERLGRAFEKAFSNGTARPHKG